MPRRIVIAGVASGLACLVPLTALAQAAAAATAPAAPASAAKAADDGQITRVVITAQKRKEDIRDVPLSVSVISAEQLQANQITTIEDLSRNVPNLSFTTQAGPGLGTYEIRGVSSQAGSATVSLYLDDVSLTTRNLYSTGTAEPRLFDLDNVQVLRGPQGTLYGSSSLGGTIKFVSKQPDLKTFGGTVTTTVSGTQGGGLNYEVQGVVNVPLVKDGAALRIGVEHGHESGYIDQVDPSGTKVLAKNINSDDYSVVKAALKVNLGHGWSLTPALFAQQENTQDIDATYLNSQTGVTLGRFQTSKTVREPGRDRLTIPSVTLTGDTDAGTFTAVLSGYQRRFNRVQDGTTINDPSFAVSDDQEAAHPGLRAAIDGLSSAVDLANKVDQTSVEVRMASKDYDPKGGSRFTWIGGAYFSDETTQVVDNEPVFGINKVFQQFDFDPATLDGGFPGDFIGDSSYYSARHYHDRQTSVFGEGTWHFTPALAFTAGLRELYATQHFTREGSFFYAGANGLTSVQDAAWTATTPSFKLNWKASEDATLYLNASKGFRLGGANRPVPDTPLVESDLASLGLPGKPPASFAPDSLWSYEAGQKLALWGNRVTWTTAVYYLKWKNIQQDITLPNAGFDFETNVGDAKSYGIETELQARVTPNLTLRASGNLTHATFSADQPAFGTVNDDGTGGYNVRKGDWIQGVPRASASLGADYHWAINDDVNAFVRGNGQWTGKSHGSLFRGDADYARASYFTADASGGVNFGSWELTAFVKNLNNNHTAIQHPNVQNVSEAYYLRPRTIGMTANYEF